MAKETGREDDQTVNKPNTKGFKGTSRRLRGGKEQRLSHRASLDWRLDRTNVCESKAQGPDIVPLEQLKETILKSRTGEMLLKEAEAFFVNIVYDAQTPVSQYYPRPDKPVISLNPHRPHGDLLNLLVRELRRAWQHKHGALVNPLNFEPDEAILVNRAQHADIFMISVKVAWELKLSGESQAWEYLAGSPMVDVSRTFEIKAQADFRTLNNGEAARAAYDKVFEESRTKALDKRVIHQMLLDESGYMKFKQQRPRVSMDLFRKLGEMPEGRNYLCISSARQPTDLCYAMVEDRSNANFLWFIKFERSFQEKELQMVKEATKLSAEIVDFAKWSAGRGQQRLDS